MAAQWIDRGEVWKHNARALQLQLKDRFRVVVDRHRRKSQDSYFSSTVQRYLSRFRDFRRDSLHSSTAFYRKRVCKDLNTEEESVITHMLQAVAVPVLGNVCHVFMNGFNCVHVSNHVASMDDPLVISSLLPPSVLLDAHNLRWTLCASDRCFRNPVTSAFFKTVKVLPVSRGDGIYQKGMDMAVSKLNSGDWVHIFPEGSRSRDAGKTMGSAKRGVGRLFLDADNVPMVVPFVHTGMQEVMPIGANFPRIGKTVTVLVGDPIHFDDLLDDDKRTEDISRENLYDAVSSRIGRRLQELKVQVDNLALQESFRSPTPVRPSDRAAGILQQVDWESFGIGSLEEEVMLAHEIPVQAEVSTRFSQDQTSSSWNLKTNCSNNGGIALRLRNDMNELVGFAARGLFMNRGAQESSRNGGEVGPLRIWKEFLRSNLLGLEDACISRLM
ncbi:hypothetical protein ACFE04_005645 [Oxalis oulophora]